MNKKLISKLLTGTIAVAMLAVGAFAVPATYAEGGTPPTPTPKPGEKLKETAEKYLSKQFERVQKNLAEFKTHLDKANQVVTKAQETIAEAKSKGKDTTKAEAALATYKAELVKAQASYDATKKIVDAHAGFDASGNVTDIKTAKDTVLDSSKALREGQKILAKATQALQKAVRENRQDRKDDKKDDKPKPSATPKP